MCAIDNKMKENPTLQDLAVEAMEIQCGCNLGALA